MKSTTALTLATLMTAFAGPALAQQTNIANAPDYQALKSIPVQRPLLSADAQSAGAVFLEGSVKQYFAVSRCRHEAGKISLCMKYSQVLDRQTRRFHEVSANTPTIDDCKKLAETIIADNQGIKFSASCETGLLESRAKSNVGQIVTWTAPSRPNNYNY